MIIQANTFAGFLDISAPETLGSETLYQAAWSFRRSIKQGDILNIPDEYYAFPNIRNAVNAGLLSIVSFDTRPYSLVVNAELGSSVGIQGTKYLFLDIHGGADDSEIRVVNQTPYLVFNNDATTRTRWNVTVPDDYVSGTDMYVEAYWSPDAFGGSYSGNVKWLMEYKSLGIGADVAVAPGQSTYVQASPASAGLLASTGTSLVIPSAEIGDNDLVAVSIARLGGDAQDTFDGQARVHVVRIRYTGRKFSS